MNLRRLIAFTLAEVLIVLGIIGVIAEITIPGLVKNVQNVQYVTSLKKAYSTINQAMMQMSTDAGCDGSFACSDTFLGTSRLDDGDRFVKYFKVLKNCKTSGNLGCTATNMSENYNGSSARYSKDNLGWYKFILADGTSIFLVPAKCAAGSSTGITGNLAVKCGSMIIDVNGPNTGPNNWGRDLFWFWISDGHGPSLYPLGGADDTTTEYVNSCTTDNKWGIGCAAKIIDSGWQMNY